MKGLGGYHLVYSTLMSAWVALSIPIVADAQGSPPYGLACRWRSG